MTGDTTDGVEFRLPAPLFQRVHDTVLQGDGRERMAVLECTRPREDRLCGVAVHPVPEDALQESTPAACSADPAVELEFLHRCFDRGTVPVVVHSHPGHGSAAFSVVDESAVDRYRQWLFHTAGQEEWTVPGIGLGVVAEQDIAVRLLEPAGDEPLTVSSAAVTVLGQWVLDAEFMAQRDGEEAVDRELYDRSIRTFGADGQQKLADTHVALVGCGGIGAKLAQELVGLGVQEVTFIDPDRVERSNLPRLPQAQPGDIGASKAALLQEDYVRQLPKASTTVVTTRVQDAERYVTAADVIVAGVDRVTPRLWVNQVAVDHLVPYIDCGAEIRIDDADQVTGMHGMVQSVVPGVFGCFDCADRGDPDRLSFEQMTASEQDAAVEQGYVDGDMMAPAPSISHLNTVVAGLASSTLMQLVTGLDVPPSLLHYDALEHRLDEVTVPRRENCVACGVDGRLPRGGDVDEIEAEVVSAAEQPPAPARGSEIESEGSLPAGVTAWFARER